MKWTEKHQIALYLLAIVLGVIAGLCFKTIATPASAAINPVLGLLIYATFMGVPFHRLREGLSDRHFLGCILLLNFLFVPLVVFALSRFVADDRALLIGMLFVLLTPCVDYVIVFTGLAGGAHDRLVVAAPLLMLGQMLLLPLYLWLIAGSEVVGAIELGPFVEAFVFLIIIPLVAAWLTQRLPRWSMVASASMVPLMMLTLFLVITSQIHALSNQLASLVRVVPIYIVFAAIMTGIGLVVSRVGRLDVPGSRAIVFSGVTRNSLVVLPLVLSLAATYELAPLAVVTQTLVELIIMVLFIRLIPRLIPHRVRSDLN